MKDIKQIENIVSLLCSGQPAVMAVYLFGSVAKDKANHDSDVDIALLLDDSKSSSFSLLSFIAELENNIGSPVDGIILNHCEDKLKFEVRRSGQLIFDRLPAFRKKFEIKGRKSYEDFLYLHNRYVNIVLYGDRNG